MNNTPKEWTFIKKIQDKVKRNHPNIVIGLGDDAFVFKNFPGYSVLCQDMMVENTHFQQDTSSAFDVGYKALAMNLSDIYAMGARPHFIQVSLGLPQNLTETWLDEFYDGMCTLADEASCEIVGGDLTTSEKIVVDVSVHGSTKSPLPRKGSQAGDILLCSGYLGLSHTGLTALQKRLIGYPESVTKHRRPQPRMDMIEELEKSASLIHAATDCSDGLINEALLLSQGLGLELYSENLPLHFETTKMAQEFEIDPRDFALWGGEDYEILLSVPEKYRDHFPQWHCLGKFTNNKGFILKQKSGDLIISDFKGFKHF